MMFNAVLCFLFGWALPVCWIQFILLIQHWTVLSPESLKKQVEDSLSMPIAKLDPVGSTINHGFRTMRRTQCLGDVGTIAIVGAIAFGLAYWAWSRDARWLFAVAGIGFVPGSAHAMGVYRDTVRRLAVILEEIPGFALRESAKDPSSSNEFGLPEGVEEAFVEFAEANPRVVGLVRNEVIAAIRARYDDVKKQIDQGLVTPKDVVRQFSLNIAGDQLEPGRHHIFRGVLTDAGKCLLSFYAACWEKEAVCGFVTQAKAQEEIAGLRKIIREIG